MRYNGIKISRYLTTVAQPRGEVEMKSMTIRLSEEQYEHLQLAAVIEGRTMASIVRQGLQEQLEDRSHALDRVKKAIAQARSEGPASENAALKMASLASQVEDAEGLGKVRAVRSRAKEPGRKPRKTTGKAGGR
jgi:predicted DNA-binding protein